MRDRSPAARWTFVALALATSVVLTVAALGGPDTATEQPPVGTLTTPLWSVRRTPTVVVDAAGRERLATAVATAVGSNQSCTTVSDGRSTLLDTSAEALTPASTMKLLTAAAALDAFGPGHRFATTVRPEGTVRDGTVDRLALVGGGDPLLATPERIAVDAADPDTAGLAVSPLGDLADAIVGAGIRSVPGGIRGVDAAFDDTRYLETWTPSLRAAIGPVGALTVNDGLTGPAGTGAPATDPALNAATELTRLLTERGVAVGAPGRATQAPDTEPVARITSPRLDAIVTEMLSASDNLTAEMLVRSLGARADATVGDRAPGTTTAGLNDLRHRLQRLGVDLDHATVADGSGLSRENALPCATLLEVLDLARRPGLGAIEDGLAIAGERGTLATRLRGTALADNLRAKTGTLEGVSGLAGTVTADRPLTFAVLANGIFGESAAFTLRESVASAIGAFPLISDAPGVVPAPTPAARACPAGDPAC